MNVQGAEVGAGGTEDEARKVGGARLGGLCLPGYGGTDFILEVEGCHQRFLSRKRVGAAWGRD